MVAYYCDWCGEQVPSKLALIKVEYSDGQVLHICGICSLEDQLIEEEDNETYP